MRRNKGAAHCAALCVYHGGEGNAGVNCVLNVANYAREDSEPHCAPVHLCLAFSSKSKACFNTHLH